MPIPTMALDTVAKRDIIVKNNKYLIIYSRGENFLSSAVVILTLFTDVLKIKHNKICNMSKMLLPLQSRKSCGLCGKPLNSVKWDY